MHIQQINNVNFGRIILHEDRTDGTASVYLAEPIDEYHRQYHSEYAAENLIDGIIDSDYDTFELRNKYNELIEEQKDNPVDIFIDLFYCDSTEPEQFFQKAAVKGKIFKQATGYWSWQRKPTTIEFLEKACRHANLLRALGRK
jgi:hypothetical protein